jgi:hypothetical protein
VQPSALSLARRRARPSAPQLENAGAGAAGLAGGAAIGANNATASEGDLQMRYDIAYTECMYSHGDTVQRAPSDGYGYYANVGDPYYGYPWLPRHTDFDRLHGRRLTAVRHRLRQSLSTQCKHSRWAKAWQELADTSRPALLQRDAEADICLGTI